jgi:hypothetical protein
MQPEAVDLDEINKKKGNTHGMGGDGFRNYMAQKIDLQLQKQFGMWCFLCRPKKSSKDKYVLLKILMLQARNERSRICLVFQSA